MSRAQGHMVPDGPCDQVYAPALNRGEVIECTKTKRHFKHFGHDTWVDADGQEHVGDLTWWGAQLSDDEKAEAERIRALGGLDTEKRQRWIDELAKSIEEGS
ncbi:hypothetical protein SEA_RASPUTIA_96 [Microbacterium phage Rasputia]|nr:hypothetical protein SEA_RASPUTIA_96 [Microbacterium phage Rasputia]